MKERTGNNNQDGRSLFFCRLICRYPKLIFFSFSCVHATVFAVTIFQYINGYNIFPAYFETLQLYVYNDAHLKELTWMSKTQYEGHVHRPDARSRDMDTRSNLGEAVEVIYKHPTEGNVLQKDFIERLRDIEEKLFNVPQYQTSFCHLDIHHTCTKPQSIMRLFDGTFSHIDAVFNDSELNNISEVVFKATFYEETSAFLDLFIGRDSIITENYSSVRITRTFIPFGLPLGILASGYYGTKGDLVEFLTRSLQPRIEAIRSQNQESLNVYYFSRLMHEHDAFIQAVSDAKLAIGSLVFIFVFMCLQTRSVFITTFGLISIVSSFLVTNLIYRYWLGYVYFGFFHLVSMFLILGIGADDLFIFHDTWRMQDQTKDDDIVRRLGVCYRRAAKTTFVTSLTTMTAFFVSGFSPLLPVKTFGIFSGILVGVNYIFVLAYFPVLLIFHHTFVLAVFDSAVKFVFKSAFNKCTPKHSDTTRNGDICDQHNRYSDDFNTDGTDSHPKYIDTILKQRYDQRDDTVHIVSGSSSHSVGQSKVSEIFYITNINESKEPSSADISNDKTTCSGTLTGTHGKIIGVFFLFITNKYVRFLVPVLLLLASAFFAHRISMLELDAQEVRLFKYDHNYAQASSIHHTYFRRNYETENQRLYLVWGMVPADISSCNQRTADYCPGQPRWDAEFDISNEETQSAMANLCLELHTLGESDAADLRIARDVRSGRYSISCFTDAMDTFFQQEVMKSNGGNRRYTDGLDLMIPVTPGNVSRFVEVNDDLYPQVSPGRERPFETLLSYWLTNGYSGVPSPDFRTYNELLGEQRIPNVTQQVTGKPDTYYGTRLKYVAIEINTTMNLYSIGYQEGVDVYEAWEDFIQNINRQMPPSLSRGIQVTQNLWHWVHVKQILANSAIMGIAVGICSAWPILVFTTFNYIIGTLAVITIGLVTACVVGMIPLVGWKLGVLESINLCMVVGLSVDYIVHLAEAYRMSESERRLDKTRDMLEAIGLSVVSGAFTTIGAGVFMLFAQIQFLYQFGIFIIATVGISLLFSLLGFSALLATCGPEGSTGSLCHVVHRLRGRSKQVTLSTKV